MKKLIILLLVPLLALKPIQTKAQFGADAAALIGFLGPYMTSLEVASKATGLDMSDLKKITQQSIDLTSRLARVYNAGNRMMRVSENTISIYTTYLQTIEYIYENSTYFDDATIMYHVSVLNKVVFGQKDNTGKLSINRVMDGVMGDLNDLLGSMEKGAQTSLTEMATYLDNVREQMNNTLRTVRSYKSYLQCIVSRKQHELGMYEIDEYLRTQKQR